MSADDIFQAKLGDEPVIWGIAYARRLCDEHGVQLADYFEESGIEPHGLIDAASLLAWLGY